MKEKKVKEVREKKKSYYPLLLGDSFMGKYSACESVFNKSKKIIFSDKPHVHVTGICNKSLVK